MNNFEWIKKLDIDSMALLLSNYIGCQYCPIFNTCVTENGCDEELKKWLLDEFEDNNNEVGN